MKITTVVVEIHEKRAHPSEMGHHDASVSYTAQVDEDEVAEDIVEILQFQARHQVAIECDRWVSDIKTQEAQESARRELQWIVDRLENRLPTDTDAEKFEKHLATLPSDEHAEWRTSLDKAKAEYLTRIKGDLDKIVERAKRRQLSLRETNDYDSLVAELPEDERQGYIDRMSDALQEYDKAQEPQVQVDPLIAVKSKSDEVPF